MMHNVMYTYLESDYEHMDLHVSITIPIRFITACATSNLVCLQV